MSAEEEPLVGLTGEVGDYQNSTKPDFSIGRISLERSTLERSFVSDSPFSHTTSRRGRRRFGFHI